MKTLLLVSTLLLSSTVVLAGSKSTDVDNQPSNSLKTMEIFEIENQGSYILNNNGTTQECPIWLPEWMCYGGSARPCDSSPADCDYDEQQ